MKTTTLNLILLCLVGCGINKVEKHELSPVFVEADLLEYVELFEDYYGVDVNITVGFTTLEGIVVGVCRKWSNGKKEVYVDIDFYEEYKEDYYAIHQLVWHELGHCIFNLEHDIDFIGEIPETVMYPYVFGTLQLYEDNFQYYMNELETRR